HSACLTLFLFTRPPPTPLSTLSLHDALPISLVHQDAAVLVLQSDGLRRPVGQEVRDAGAVGGAHPGPDRVVGHQLEERLVGAAPDRKSTRLNSSHRTISYAVFCLKKKKKKIE